MRTARRVLLTIVLLLVVVLTSFEAYVYAHAVSVSRRAQKTLAEVSQLQPGMTPISELSRLSTTNCRDSTRYEPHEVLSVYSIPNLSLSPESYMASIYYAALRKVVPLRGTYFSVYFTCDSQTLLELEVIEMQNYEGSVHPFSNSTKLLPKGISANENALEGSPQQKYWLYERNTFSYEKGKKVWESPTLNRFIYVTPQSSAEERRRAMAFHLECFYRLRGCQDVNLILNPAPNR